MTRDPLIPDERVAASALSLLKAEPSRDDLVVRMAKLAREEIRHLDQVIGHLRSRGWGLAADRADRFARGLLAQRRGGGGAEALCDRPLVNALIEARSWERLNALGVLAVLAVRAVAATTAASSRAASATAGSSMSTASSSACAAATSSPRWALRRSSGPDQHGRFLPRSGHTSARFAHHATTGPGRVVMRAARTCVPSPDGLPVRVSPQPLPGLCPGVSTRRDSRTGATHTPCITRR